MLAWLTLIIAALAGLFVFFQHHAGILDATSAGFTAAGVIGLLVALYVGAHKSRGHIPRSVYVGIALAVAGILAAAWLWNPSQTGSELSTAPTGSPSESRHVSVLIRRDSEGKFVARGQINAIATDFLIDTGASAVMIRHSDAEKAGVDLSSLSFTTPVQTANGTVYAAPIRLRSITIGMLRREDVEALVAQPGNLNENLLGISFLRGLASYDVNGEFLTLRE
ncbi:MAG TPA: TIGR02281 family clan AA aspartic protease [Hyphomicrobium sp.]|nr:TIGR02281 family clan AA aspartic protease [Hyphomicrobium sp.]